MKFDGKLISASDLYDTLCRDKTHGLQCVMENGVGVGTVFAGCGNDFANMIGKAPEVDALPVTADELKHLINDTIAYIWRLEDRGCDKTEFGYDSRKALLEKLKKFYNEHFPEADCHF